MEVDEVAKVFLINEVDDVEEEGEEGEEGNVVESMEFEETVDSTGIEEVVVPTVETVVEDLAFKAVLL